MKKIVDGKEEVFAQIGDRLYSRHALECMAPDTLEVRAILEKRAIDIATNVKKYKPGTPDFNNFVKDFVDPRNVPPMVVEDVIKNGAKIPGDTAGTFVHSLDDISVVVNSSGDVVTVISKRPKGPISITE